MLHALKSYYFTYHLRACGKLNNTSFIISSRSDNYLLIHYKFYVGIKSRVHKLVFIFQLLICGSKALFVEVNVEIKLM